MQIPLDHIKPNPNQPRTQFTGIDGLAQSIQEKGLLEPILVRPVDEHYEIIHGERRYKAVQQLEWETIDAITREATDAEAYELALIENVQREDLTPIEQALAFQQLQEKGYTQQQIAETLNKSQSYIAQKLRLLSLPDFLQYFVQHQLLSENHARRILTLKNIYGEELEAIFHPESPSELIESLKMHGDLIPHKVIQPIEEEQDRTLLILNAMAKPEDTVFIPWDINEDKKTHFIHAGASFVKYVSKHTLMQWERAGFWWCLFTVALDLSVVELTQSLNAWEGRYYTALDFVSKYKQGKATDRQFTVRGNENQVIRYSAEELFQAYAEDLLCSSSYHNVDSLYRRFVQSDNFLKLFEQGMPAPLAVRNIQREPIIIEA